MLQVGGCRAAFDSLKGPSLLQVAVVVAVGEGEGLGGLGWCLGSTLRLQGLGIRAARLPGSLAVLNPRPCNLKVPLPLATCNMRQGGGGKSL